MEPIEGPGMCGADFPLKVAAIGESPKLAYGDEIRPPAGIPNSSSGQMPRWPVNDPRYGRGAPVEVEPVQGARLRWTPGPPPAETNSPAGAPISLNPPSTPEQDTDPEDDDIPDDAILPPGRGKPTAPRTQPAYNPPVYQPRDPQPQRPALGPSRPQTTGTIMPAALSPTATLACPLVSALDRWVSEGVQPAALHWFGAQVVTIKQISAYSCRSMVGAGTYNISEHAFGNALDVAGFILADGRKIMVKDGWRGSPEEQGFLHDVQLYACETFTTVLAPGYNAAHYDHIHVDLMRRSSGRRPCRPEAIQGEVVAARARALFASKHRGPAYTGSIASMAGHKGQVAGEDGSDAGVDGDFDDEETTGSIAPPPRRSGAALAGDAAIRAQSSKSFQ